MHKAIKFADDTEVRKVEVSTNETGNTDPKGLNARGRVLGAQRNVHLEPCIPNTELQQDLERCETG